MFYTVFMYKWFSKTRNRLVYFILISFLPVILLIGFSAYSVSSKINYFFARDFLIPGALLWEKIVPVFTVAGLALILLGFFNLLGNKPSKYYFIVGMITVVLISVYWTLLQLFFGPPAPLYL